MTDNPPLQPKARPATPRRRRLPHRSPPFPIVAIGASAGGLEACGKLVDALPPLTGMAFILVQHLDPNHKSLITELLTDHTAMTVEQAVDGMAVQPDHLYVIPPGAYLSAQQGVLRLTSPTERHGARLPFDFLLRSLAQNYGNRVIAVVLSGTGADGSLGLKDVKKQSGFVIAQKPDEAAFDGMPRSAIATGAVDLVLPVAEIPHALAVYGGQVRQDGPSAEAARSSKAADQLADIINLLRDKTQHDFRLYKPGTLHRRIERRMSMVKPSIDNMASYLQILRHDDNELNLLAEDLLINVTRFFRDPVVFDGLAADIIPDLVRNHAADRPLRIWIAGCSSGEEAYSLGILFLEAIAVQKSNIKIQIFASDVDPDAVATAREGFYPATIADEVSAVRLAKFFTSEDKGYRVAPELRSSVLFTVQDVLTDPPFADLDMVSCRNLLIYLQPEAQARILGLFHFALREGGILLLGNSETVGSVNDLFEVISKPDRLYRRIGRGRPLVPGVSLHADSHVRTRAPGHRQPRHTAPAELCRRLVLDIYAPAAVLINSKNEILYSHGPTDRYLRVASGHPTHGLLSMTRAELRTKLNAAIQRVRETYTRTLVTGCRTNHDGQVLSFSVDVHPVTSERERLLLVCFIDETADRSTAHPTDPRDLPRVAELEQELVETRAELQSAIRDLEVSGEEQRDINEETLSSNEEFQSTNEELLTSKEELQSLNEELTALNGQLQESLQRQRTTSDDLQNVLYSTDVATLFLDRELNIRLFTPATKSLFHVIQTDIGRPLADLNSLITDMTLLPDAKEVLKTITPIEREIETSSGNWFIRRILPYRTRDNDVDGVVITFVDITERKHAARALEAAKQVAETANIAKSSFLAAASHDLRQPLQTLVLLQGLLATAVVGTKAKGLSVRIGETLGTMSSMLNTLLDINQIETGIVEVDMVDFPVSDLLDRMKEEFTSHAQAKGLLLRVAPCGLTIRTDPRLLEQIIRNLLSNAVKYTHTGKILLGCRRMQGKVRIEIWDTGIGIPQRAFRTIFEEYRQLNNPARERSRGLGLGLSIANRLAGLLGNELCVRSKEGKGSVISLEVMLPAGIGAGRVEPYGDTGGQIVTAHTASRPSPPMVLVVEDDPEVCDLLEIMLKDAGYQVTTAADGIAAIGRVTRDGVDPQLILTDYNLPNGMTGMEMAAKVREGRKRAIPIIILTGDISTTTLRAIQAQDVVHFGKPVRPQDLLQTVRRLLPVGQVPAPMARAALTAAVTSEPSTPLVYVVDDDHQVLEALRSVLVGVGHEVEGFDSCEAFLAVLDSRRNACLVIDAYLPGMDGFELLQRLRDSGHKLPAIMITGHGDVAVAVRAMKAGVLDFIEKPVAALELLACVDHALEKLQDTTKLSAWRKAAAGLVASLTARQRQVMEMVLAGHPSKNIAADLGISQRTVENHRASIMKKTGSRSLPALARLALAADE